MYNINCKMIFKGQQQMTLVTLATLNHKHSGKETNTTQFYNKTLMYLLNLSHLVTYPCLRKGCRTQPNSMCRSVWFWRAEAMSISYIVLLSEPIILLLLNIRSPMYIY